MRRRSDAEGSNLAVLATDSTHDDVEVDCESVTVTWGKEGFSPIQFHVFEVGPFSATARLLPGETMGQVYARLMAQLGEMARKEFEVKLPAYLERIRYSAEVARSSKGGR